MKFSSKLALPGLGLVQGIQAFTGQQLRILPLGDSITYGATAPYSQGGYRGPLVQNLDGNFVNMVGSLSDGLFRDNQHEGWSGYGIAGPSNITEHFLIGGGHANPNVIIVHAGTNDIFLYNSPSSVANNLDALMHDIHYLNPTATVILCHIGPWCPGTQNIVNVTAYNNKITSLVNDYQSMGWRVVLADIYNLLSASTDITCVNNTGVHPNSGGYIKMANHFTELLGDVVSNNPSWLSPPQNISYGGTTGEYTCPTTANANATFANPSSVSGLANSQNQFAGIFCTNVQGNANICSCSDPSGPNGANYVYTVAKTRSCQEMTTVRTQAVHFADINGDGKADYLYVGAGGQVNSWLNYNQTGAPIVPPMEDDTAASDAFYSQGGIFGGAYGNRSQVQFGDVNGDGLAEYLQVFPNGQVWAYSPQLVYSTSPTQAGPSFVGKGSIFNGTVNGISYPGAGITFADFNGDSLADLAYVDFAGDITVFLNQGASGSSFATFGSPKTVFTAPSGISRDNVVLADTNGDGNADLILVDRTTGAFNVYQNLGGTSGFNSTARISSASLDGKDGSNVQFANVGGNGRADWIDVDPNTSAFTIYNSECYISIPGLFGYYIGFQ